MKTPYRYLSLILAAALLLLLNPAHSLAQEQPVNAQIEAILIEASNSGSEIDAGLSSYAKTLRRLFRFSSYRLVDKKYLRLTGSKTSTAQLANQDILKVSARQENPNTLFADIKWSKDTKVLLGTKVTLRPNKPALLGGPRSDSGSYILLVVWK